MNETQEFPDLTWKTNQLWGIKLAGFWTLLMVPSDIAKLQGAAPFEFALMLLGMVGFFILLFKGLKTLTGGEGMRELADRGMKFPWTLMFGVCVWHLCLMMPVQILLLSIFGTPTT